jgi:hypothetical protein
VFSNVSGIWHPSKARQDVQAFATYHFRKDIQTSLQSVVETDTALVSGNNDTTSATVAENRQLIVSVLHIFKFTIQGKHTPTLARGFGGR